MRPVRPTVWLFALGLLTFLTSLLAATEPAPPAFASVPAQLLQNSPSLGWDERQWVQADKGGQVYLFRARTLEVFALTAAGGLDPKGRLEAATETGGSRPIEGAALSPAGDLWVLSSKPNHLEVFQSGKRRESIDCPWMVSGVAAPAGEPIVSVLPMIVDSATVTGTRPSAPPSLARWDGKSWSTFLEGTFGNRSRTEPGSRGSVEGVSLPEQMRGEFARVIAGIPGGGLWVADRYAYRARSLSPLGAVKDELRVGEGKVIWAERSSDDWKRLETVAKKDGFTFDRRSLSRVQAREVVRALTLGRDGALYLLVAVEGGFALDRFDPALVHLDRVLVTGIAGVPGNLTLAAGSDGLYLAAPSGRLGLWRIEREALEKAEWKRVPEATLNGQPLEPAKGAEPAPVAAEKVAKPGE